MTSLESFLQIMLWLHIPGGALALMAGIGAMLTRKGSLTHRNFGKVYFWSMSVVFIGALALAIGHNKDFLLMVSFFGYYMTVRGYRILYLKKLSSGQKPVSLDWMIMIISGSFILYLLFWGGYELYLGEGMGIVGIAFGSIGTSFLAQDVKNFVRPPKEKMHWWYGHIASMGGSYISAVTASIVVNIKIGQFNWILWILPAAIGGSLIGRSIRYYKLQHVMKINS